MFLFFGGIAAIVWLITKFVLKAAVGYKKMLSDVRIVRSVGADFFSVGLGMEIINVAHH